MNDEQAPLRNPAVEQVIAAFARDELSWVPRQDRGQVVRVSGVGTVVAAALQSTSLHHAFRSSEVGLRIVAPAGGPQELVDRRDWNLGLVLSPFKQDVLAYCDKLSRTAGESGAVDTLIRCGGRTWGLNTNAAAASATLKMLLGLQAPRRVLLIGTGASSRSLICALRRDYSEASVYIWGRSIDRVKALLHRWPDLHHAVEPADAQADLVVNATTVGQVTDDLPQNFTPVASLRPGVRFLDLNNRFGTLQERAVSAGCLVCSGTLMQGVTNAIRASIFSPVDKQPE